MAWPLATRAQQPVAPVIGFLDGQSSYKHLMMAFRQALKDAGYVEGRNVAIEYRSANGHTDRLLTLAGDLVDRSVIELCGAAAVHDQSDDSDRAVHRVPLKRDQHEDVTRK